MSLRIPKKEFTATVFARTLREAHCEKCGADYVYVLTLRAEETRSTSLLSPMSEAEEAATKAAAEALSAQVKDSVAPIPCPSCGWLQAAMVDHLRAHAAPRSGGAGCLTLVLGGFGLAMAAILALIGLEDDDPASGEFVGKAAGASVALLAFGVIVLVTRHWRVSRWNPNDCDLTAQADRGRRLAVLKDEPDEAKLVDMLAAADEDQRRQERNHFAGDLRFRAFTAFVVMLIAFGFLVAMWGELKAGFASFTWPQTTGRLVAASVGSEMRGKHRYFWPEVQYSYEVAGKEFLGTRYCLGTDDSVMQSGADATVRRLRDNPNVVVYYNPAAPAESLIARGLPFWRAVSIGVFLGLGTVCAVFSWRFSRQSQKPAPIGEINIPV